MDEQRPGSESATYRPFGEYLARLRTRAGLTQRELSEALGYSSPEHGSQFERGIAIPPLKEIKMLNDLCGNVNDIEELIDVILRCERNAHGTVPPTQ